MGLVNTNELTDGTMHNIRLIKTDIKLISSQFTKHTVQEPSNILRSKIVEDLE
jgi:hypothetical protein